MNFRTKSLQILLFSLPVFFSATAYRVADNNANNKGLDSLQTLKKRFHLGVSAHRGNSKLAPENTLATFKSVLAMGVDYIEIDVRTTKDGQLMILHDGTLNRTTNGEGPMKNFTFDELKKLSAGKGFHETFQNERIPTLQETTQLVADWNKTHKTSTNLYVDCKDVAPEPLVKELAAKKLLKEAVFYGSDEFLLSLKKIYPQARLMPSLDKPEEIEEKVNRLHPYAFDVRWTILTDSLVNQIHQKKVKVFSDVLGILDNPVNYKKATDMGVDIIQTDFVRKVYSSLLN
ncbi:glycerophosphodiester phosphodiesterase [Emticicia sp. 17c]|uniref:glycerophosphodiester phosphodiesterase n=1 Tax=Emticicia sp. 17c TaxID=3127704 RepID=UPI00301C405D